MMRGIGWSLRTFAKFAPSNLADTFKTERHDKIVSRFNHSQQLTANYALLDVPFDARLLYLALRESVGGSYTGSEAF